MVRAVQACALALFLCRAAQSSQPNPPAWPSTVKIYDSDTPVDEIQRDFDEAWHYNGYQNSTPGSEPGGRFSDKRFTFLFKPGTYDVNASIGYYMHVLGVGVSPLDVVFAGSKPGPHVPCDIPKPGPGQLVTFWRGAERFKHAGNMDWLVSQAAWLRDIHVVGDLTLQKNDAYASGGYLGNSVVEGRIIAGGQQQWFTRNTRLNTFSGVAWSAVFVGVQSTSNQPDLLESQCVKREINQAQRVVVREAPAMAEKPFISIDPNDANKWNLNVPQVRTHAVGPDWRPGTVIPFEQVYVTQPTDSAAHINAQLAQGYHVVVTPGVYSLSEAIKITHSDTVLLCLGLSTLLSTVGNVVVDVAPGLEGVRIAGCLLEAGQETTPTLLQWGDGTHNTAANPKPSFVYDLFTRVGGPGFNGNIGNTATADVMVRLDADDIHGDNLWLWRADHYEAGSSYAFVPPDLRMTYYGDLPNDHGIVVTGDRVRIYHLAVEHSLKDNTIWEGEDGEVYFYQNELPYEVKADFGTSGYVAYRVADHVSRHEAWGVGAYTYFRDFQVWMDSGIACPHHLVKNFHYPFVIKLSAQGGANHTINSKGYGTAQTQASYPHDQQYMCEWKEATASQPNPPRWPSTVKIYDRNTPVEEIQGDLDEAWHYNGYQNSTPGSEPGGRFSDRRFAFMFKPGTYDVNASIGYYTHVLGVGATPDDVVFAGSKPGPHVPCDIPKPGPGQLVTFWRGAERFQHAGDMDWLVSQAAWLRDIHVMGDLILQKNDAYASGGYLGNSVVEGNTFAGGQQQWFTRNSRLNTYEGVAWSAVFVGVQSISNQQDLLESQCVVREKNQGQRVVVPEAPLMAEKPYITVDPNDENKWNLNVPQVRTNARGPDWSPGTVIPFEQVYVTQPSDTAADINAQLEAGYHIVVTPGVYSLSESIKIRRSNTVFLCLGLSTLLSTVGNVVVDVAPGLEGVRLGGCLLEAGQETTPTLLQWGDGSHYNGADPKPSFIYDLFTRVGGPGFNGNIGNNATADVMVRLDADDIHGDNLWLWRADHYEAGSSYAFVPPDLRMTYYGDLPNDHGIIVTGDRVRIYHLAVEHSLKDNTIWEGEDGEVYFYQNELPYEVKEDFGTSGYVAYRVADHVSRHEAWGVGAYTYFRDFKVWMRSGIACPHHLVKNFHYPFVIKLSAQGGTNATINSQGPGTAQTPEVYPHDFQFMCEWNQAPPSQPNPPQWPSTVKIYDSNTPVDQIQSDFDEAWHYNGYQNRTVNAEPGGRFSDKRFAFLFKPGTYDVNASIGYYMHVLGVGATPDDVVFAGSKPGPHVPCDYPKPQVGQLVTFWRGAERFQHAGNMDWLVSQAAWIRDVHVMGNLTFQKDGAYASGGYLGNSVVEGQVLAGGQQQWFTRNSRLRTYSGVSWSAVFVGVETTTNQQDLLESQCVVREKNQGQRVVVQEAPLMAEKPFITVDPNDANKFNLNVPQVRRNARGPDWSPGTVIPFEQVYVTQPTDTAADINAQLDAGFHIVVTPGVYSLSEAIRIRRSNTVFLCLGLSTLLSTVGNVVVDVAPGLEGVRLGGCLLEAGQETTPTLLQWGDGSHFNGADPNPSFMYDLFTRVGGPGFNGNIGNTATADVMVRLDADDVHGDNLWLWRADHYEAGSSYAYIAPDLRMTYYGHLKNDHGIIVTGNRVRIYHLAVEHTLKDNTIWEGEDGEVYFYQNELPYEVKEDFGTNGYVAYRVADHVSRHNAWGVGAYTYFRDFKVWMNSGIACPDHLVDHFYYPFVIKLSAQGGINHTINDKGPGTAQTPELYAHDYQFMCEHMHEATTATTTTMEGLDNDTDDAAIWQRILFAVGLTVLFSGLVYVGCTMSKSGNLPPPDVEVPIATDGAAPAAP